MIRGRAPGQRAVFLDRDGTINVKAADGEYVTSPDRFRLLPGAVEAIRLLNAAGHLVVVVTNQRGIALGHMTEDDLGRVHARMRDELARGGARVDAVYHCPHERDTCSCRKPGTALMLRAANDLAGLALPGSAIIGDSASDMQAGAELGLTRILIADARATATVGCEHRAPSLLAGVRWLLRQPDPWPAPRPANRPGPARPGRTAR